jgi:uncharacterized protein YdaU (DUF1376 family)
MECGSIDSKSLIFFMSKETFYFSHDYNARNDEKIISLLFQHGYAGYGIYWALIENLYHNANALRTHYECIAYELRADCELVKSVINDFDLFEIDGEFFYSKSIERRLNERKEKSIKASISASKRWKTDDNANAMRTHSERNAIKESKVKDIKVKDIIIKGKKFEFNDIVNLPSNYIQSIQEQLYTLQKKKVEESVILKLWESFRLEKLTGEIFYNSEKEFFKHFVNWIKLQKFVDNGKSESDKRIEAMQDYANRYR